MSELRKKFIQLRKKTGFKKTDFEGIMSRHTLDRFEKGGDITLSKVERAVEKMGKSITIWM